MVTIRLRLTVKTIITLVYPCKYTMTLFMFKISKLLHIINYEKN